TPARGQGGRPAFQPALGLRHHHPQTLERPKAPAGRHHRLRRPHGPGLEITTAFDDLGCGRTAPRGLVRTLRPATPARQGLGFPPGKWARVWAQAVATPLKSTGLDRLSHPLPQPPIQRLGRILLRHFQTRLPLPPAFGKLHRGHEEHSRLDCPLQRVRSSQRSGHVVSSLFLSTIVDRITHKNYNNPCPVLTGSHHCHCWRMASFCSAETRLRRPVLTGESCIICICLNVPFKLSKSQLGQTTHFLLTLLLTITINLPTRLGETLENK